jgi:hypothetical protein
MLSRRDWVPHASDESSGEVSFENKAQLSLVDPFMLSRIKYPVRSGRCKHRACFCLDVFLRTNQTHCPVGTCRVNIPKNKLYVDKWLQDILENMPEDVIRIEYDTHTGEFAKAPPTSLGKRRAEVNVEALREGSADLPICLDSDSE